MPITINGSGSVTGISAGGLPDSCITTDDIAANAVTAAKLGADQASGLAKAWVNFDGAGTVAIRASFNVSSITDNGTGDYTVNFTTAMVDANFSALCSMDLQTTSGTKVTIGAKTYTSSSVRVYIGTGNGISNGTNSDDDNICVAIFR